MTTSSPAPGRASVLQLAASVQFVVPAPPVQVTVVVIGVPLGAISGVAPPVGGSEGGSEDCVVFPPGVFPQKTGRLAEESDWRRGDSRTASGGLRASRSRHDSATGAGPGVPHVHAGATCIAAVAPVALGSIVPETIERHSTTCGELPCARIAATATACRQFNSKR